MTDAIHLENLSKVYRRGWKGDSTQALDAVTLTVAGGEAFGFIGPNGAGKSTTIKILTGALTVFSGSALIFGQSVERPRSRQGMGYVPENPYLNDFLTPLEVLAAGVAMHRLHLPDIRGHCMGWLERFGIAAVASKTIRGFSKGMTQRVALAHAMAIQPRLLILDEPLSGLDPIGRRDVVDILSEYKRGGGTLFFTSHVLHDVERLADRFGLINEGKLRAVQSPAALAGEEEIVQVRTLGSAVVDGMQEEFTGRWICTIQRSHLWSQLDALKAAGHVLIEVKPTLSLESAFMRAVGRSGC